MRNHARASINIDNIKQKIASLLGTGADQVRIQDVAVNPASGKVYVSVSRGRGPDAQPVIRPRRSRREARRVSARKRCVLQGHASQSAERSGTGSGRRRQNSREFAITDLAYVDGTVVVAGLSNEEFSSNLRTIPYPFSEVKTGRASRFSTAIIADWKRKSPIRTFVPISWGGNPQIIAAYTCTPLVRIPLAELRSGVKIRGTTIAELGNHNQPLDIIAYEKDGKHFLLMANAVRGVMKISTEGLLTREGHHQARRNRNGRATL